MVAIPDQLTWELVKKNNSFLKKKNGHTKRSGSVTFSTEAGNAKSLNLFKYSGIANSQVVDVVCTDDNKATLLKKAASKSSKQPSKSMSEINISKDFKRAESVISKQTFDVFYRKDLQAAVMGKYTKVYQANRRAKGVTKPVPVKKGRKSN